MKSESGFSFAIASQPLWFSSMPLWFWFFLLSRSLSISGRGGDLGNLPPGTLPQDHWQVHLPGRQELMINDQDHENNWSSRTIDDRWWPRSGEQLIIKIKIKIKIMRTIDHQDQDLENNWWSVIKIIDVMISFQRESSYSVGTVGYEDVDCDCIDHTYVR